MSSRLIIVEPHARWAIAMRQFLREEPVRVYEVRTFAGAARELQQFPNSIVLWAAEAASAARVAQQLLRIGRVFPRTRHIVAADRTLRPFERLWREAGAIHVVLSPRMLDQVVRIVRRHLARVAEPVRSIDSVIWATLPWALEESTEQ